MPRSKSCAEEQREEVCMSHSKSFRDKETVKMCMPRSKSPVPQRNAFRDLFMSKIHSIIASHFLNYDSL